MATVVDETEAKIFMIRIAEQAECYDQMLDLVMPVVKDKMSQLKPEERILFAVACKNKINKQRLTFRTINVVLDLMNYRNRQEILKEYLEKCRAKYDEQCTDLINLIDQNVLNVEKDNKEANQEGMAFFLKMKADFYRYICEAATDDRLKQVRESAKQTYESANEINLPPCNAIKLQIVLNYSVFEAEFNGNI